MRVSVVIPKYHAGKYYQISVASKRKKEQTKKNIKKGKNTPIDEKRKTEIKLPFFNCAKKTIFYAIKRKKIRYTAD